VVVNFKLARMKKGVIAPLTWMTGEGDCRNLRLQAKVAFRSAKEAFAWEIGRTDFLQSYCQQAAGVEFSASHY